MTRIRPARATDLPALVALELAVFPDPWSATQWRLELQAVRGLVLVIEDAHGLAGAAAVRHLPDRGEVLNLAIQPRARRRGYGRCLLRAACEWLHQGGQARVGLEVRPDNNAALALYARFGFRTLGRRPRYYQDGSDALILEAPLPLDPDAESLCYPRFDS